MNEERKPLNVTKVFEAIARIMSQREGREIKVVSVVKKEEKQQ